MDHRLNRLNEVIRTFQGAPVIATLIMNDDMVHAVSLTQFPNAFSEMLGLEGISHVVLSVGDCDEGYEITYAIAGAPGNVSITTTVTYQLVDCDQDPYDGHCIGNVVNRNITKHTIRHRYEYGKTVIVPVRMLATLLAAIL